MVARGLRDRSEIALMMDFARPIPPSPAASDVLLRAFAQRGIEWHPRREVCELDPGLEQQVRELLQRHELPTVARGVDADVVLETMSRNKKARSGRVKFSLLEAVGRGRSASLREGVATLLGEVARWHGAEDPQDDISILGTEISPG